MNVSLLEWAVHYGGIIKFNKAFCPDTVVFKDEDFVFLKLKYGFKKMK